MLTRHLHVMAALALTLAACASDDASPPDADLPDPGAPDARVQAPPVDGGAPDGGTPDAGTQGTTDARPAPPALVLGARQLALVEGATATVTVQLDRTPAAPVDVAIASSSPAAFRTTPATLRFDATSWSVPQTVTVSAIEDDDADAARGAVLLTAAGLADVTIDVDVADNDSAAAISAPANLLVGEGNATFFAVTLTRAPARTVEVAVTSRAPDVLAVSPALLTFTPATWHVPQRVTVTAAIDTDLDDERVSIGLAGGDLAPVVVNAVVADGSDPRIALSVASVTLDEGAGSALTVVLRDRPARDTVVTLTSSDPTAVSVEPARLTFTPAAYDRPLPVAIRSLADADGDPDSAAITVAIGGRAQASVAVTVRDSVARTIVAAPSPFAAAEGENRQLEVSLSAPPVAPVIVRARSEDTASVVVTPTSLLFSASNWNVAQRITVIAVPDLDVADETTALVLEADGYQAARVETTVDDAHVQELVATQGLLRVVEGESRQIGVMLRRPPGRSVVVTAAIAATGVATIAPAELTFTDATWDDVQFLTLAGARDGNTVDDRTELRLRTGGAVDLVREVEVVDTRVP
jgi:hypothetical protein